MPSMKQSVQSSGRKVVYGAMRLHTITPSAAAVSSVLLVKRNFMRKRMGKYTAIPARLQYRHIWRSSRMSDVSLTM